MRDVNHTFNGELSSPHVQMQDISPETGMLAMDKIADSGFAKPALLLGVGALAAVGFMWLRDREQGKNFYAPKGDVTAIFAMDETTYVDYQTNIDQGARAGAGIPKTQIIIKDTSAAAVVHGTYDTFIYQRNAKVTAKFDHITGKVVIDIPEGTIGLRSYLRPETRKVTDRYHGHLLDAGKVLGALWDTVDDNNVVSKNLDDIDETVEKAAEIAGGNLAVEKCGPKVWQAFGQEQFVNKNKEAIIKAFAIKDVKIDPTDITVNITQPSFTTGYTKFIKDLDNSTVFEVPKAKASNCTLKEGTQIVDADTGKQISQVEPNVKGAIPVDSTDL